MHSRVPRLSHRSPDLTHQVGQRPATPRNDMTSHTHPPGTTQHKITAQVAEDRKAERVRRKAAFVKTWIVVGLLSLTVPQQWSL